MADVHVLRHHARHLVPHVVVARSVRWNPEYQLRDVGHFDRVDVCELGRLGSSRVAIGLRVSSGSGWVLHQQAWVQDGLSEVDWELGRWRQREGFH